MANLPEITEQTFDEAVEGDTPVLVDFWAEWCAPCRAIAPILEELDSELGDRLNVVQLNVDEHPNPAQKLGVMSIPTLILFKKGEEKARIVGSKGKEQFLKELEPHLA